MRPGGRQVRASSSARQARSQRRHASPQIRQWKWCGAWRSHSSPQLWQMATHASRSRNSPFAGMTLPGQVVATFLRGRPTVLEGKPA